MAVQTASREQAAVLRSRGLSLAKTCSIGFESGENFGNRRSLAPAFPIARRAPAARDLLAPFSPANRQRLLPRRRDADRLNGADR